MLIGRRLSGRYKIIEVIGGGGMANVYLARDIILERDVAIKVLRLDFSNDEEFIKRFRREAHSATSLAHPNIVSIYDVGEEDDIYYIVMEYVDGQTLKQYIQRHAPLHPREALNIMEQLASAISHAHHNQIVHRDIKPQNILIDRNGTVKVTDFGIAVALSSTTITQTNSVLGSVHYLSPEQARGGMSTRKSDIYSLGIVMFELLTGRVPFEGESAVSIALKHLQSETPSPRRWNSTIPQSVENIILKSTAKDPFYRYDSADEMEADLHTALYPDRINEKKFVIPSTDDQITKAIPIIKDDDHLLKTNDTIVRDSPKKANNMDADSKKPKKKKSKVLITLAVIFFLIIAAGISAVTIIPSLFLPEDVTVPNVENKEYDEAVKILREEGFEIGEVIKKVDDEVPEGYVIRTNPKAGTETKEKAVITIYESTGKKKEKFENYVDENIDDVKDRLDQYLNVHEEWVHDESSYGTILEQSIKEGEEVVPEETEVIFKVSKGPETIKLRDLKGYNVKGINDYAKEVGLNIDYTEQVYDDSVEAGLVISQSPAQGTEMQKGASVKVIMSKGKEPKEPKKVERKITIPYSGEEGTTQKVQIKIQDAGHPTLEVAEEFDIASTTTITLQFEINPDGVAQYMVLIDGRLDQEEVIQYSQ
ncbi:Stk1 family PASTA domain-containing Ser/Thr kinase [Fredinandcohnia quinoae]|uniref:Serine/threonine-protein kinase PrkC n=1 Tax=Fredinandcohnia quinoae TaxID=2918902 RepID=A0AAW5E4X4_9BACI|nr:Stk1 family PASTA domain-containing Ser/Thr kinase [Fredinandcohnia sp. SECRCQ15]MCH1623829.1 Stk1 family PASTA domain-containing Ser/Thr kinase [Fredinandcohnia sp. SECRCQ15]